MYVGWAWPLRSVATEPCEPPNLFIQDGDLRPGLLQNLCSTLAVKASVSSTKNSILLDRTRRETWRNKGKESCGQHQSTGRQHGSGLSTCWNSARFPSQPLTFRLFGAFVNEPAPPAHCRCAPAGAEMHMGSIWHKAQLQVASSSVESEGWIQLQALAKRSPAPRLVVLPQTVQGLGFRV